MTLTERFEALKVAEAKAQRLRTEAETLQRVARQRLDAIDTEIKSHGVDPDKIEQEIAALDVALDTQMTVLAAKLAEETQVYETIIAAARTAGLQA